MIKYLSTIATLSLTLLCGCSSPAFKEQVTEANPEALYIEHRTEIIAQDLVASGQFTDIDEAREVAADIAKKEYKDQKDAALENRNTENFYKQDRNERAE